MMLVYGTQVILESLLSEETCSVPQLEGISKDEADYRLESLGLNMEILEYVESDIYPKDYVVSQNYQAGLNVKQGTTIGVTISKGMQSISNVDNESVEDSKIPFENVFENIEESNNTNTTYENLKHIKIDLSNKGKNQDFNVKVILQENIGTKTILYEFKHNRSDGVIPVLVPENATGIIKVYIDDELDSEAFLK